MLSVLRNRFGVPGVISVIALVLAMTGGAWAASKYIITSTKQIKPSVLNSLKGKAGPQGPAGPAGPQGSAGPKGADGAPGANGVSVTTTKLEPGEGGCPEGGAQFKVGSGTPTVACNGEEGEQGPEGSPWVAGAVPSGSEMRGTWALNANTAGAESVYAAVSTAVPLGGPIAIAIKAPGSFGPIECAGTVENPLPPTNEGAPMPSVLCVYAGGSTNVNLEEMSKELGSSQAGAVLKLKTNEAGPANAFGTWSMYAP
jgi:hypothetical protein